MSEENKTFKPPPETCACCGRTVEPTPGNFADVEYIHPIGKLCKPCRLTVKVYVDGAHDAQMYLRRFMVDPNDTDNRERVMKFLEEWGGR